jgi:hypothetical protein
MSLGVYGETIFMHMIPAFRSDENTTAEIALGFVELVGNTGGVAALIGSLIKDPDTSALGLGTDGLCTFISTLTGEFPVLYLTVSYITARQFFRLTLCRGCPSHREAKPRKGGG